ncbi:MAG: hypothetical protein Q9225_003264 [Loekoesia sp. 1 TL-2023]
MHLLNLYILWHTLSLVCNAYPQAPTRVLSSFHPKSFLDHELHPPPDNPAKNLHKRVDSSHATIPNDASSGSDSNATSPNPNVSPIPIPTYTPSNSMSHDYLPSSSGPFTPINLPSNWTIYPMTSIIAIRPVQLAAQAMEQFYTSILQRCAQNFWSEGPSAGLLNNALSLGSLALVVVGDPKYPRLPWWVLVALVQGMLERTRRGWTSTWDGSLSDPTGRTYRVSVTVVGQNPGPQCNEELPPPPPRGYDGDSDDDDRGRSCKKHKGG